jgi:hypothetical protein
METILFQGAIRDNRPPFSHHHTPSHQLTPTLSTVMDGVEEEKGEEKRQLLFEETVIDEMFEFSRRSDPDVDEREKRFPFLRQIPLIEQNEISVSPDVWRERERSKRTTK